MIGILGGMGTQAGLDFCTKLAKLNRGKTDQNYPIFLLYNKSNIPDRKQNLKKYNKVLKSLLDGCKFLERKSQHWRHPSCVCEWCITQWEAQSSVIEEGDSLRIVKGGREGRARLRQ